MKLAPVLASAFVLLSIGCKSHGDKAEAAAQAMATAWLAKLDQGQQAVVWSEGSRYLRGLVPQHEWVAVLQRARLPLGKAVNRTLERTQHTDTLPGAPDAKYIVMTYETRFERKHDAAETLVAVQDNDGSWRVAGYYIR